MAGRILIADDVATNRIVLKVKLSAAQYAVVQCRTAAQARQIARADEADLIILPPCLPDMEGAALCRLLKADPATAALPLLMLLDRNEGARRLAALSAGADEVMSIPFSEICLLARVRSLLRAHDTDRELQRRDLTTRELGFSEPAPQMIRPGRVALIGANGEQAISWKSGLRGRTPHRLTVMNRSEAMQLSGDDTCPDLFVLAADLGAANDGVRLLSELRSRSATRHAAIVMVHPTGADEAQANALDIGANALLEQGFDPAELALRIDRQIQRKRNTDRLRHALDTGLRLATVDPLTGLFNRRYGDHHLAGLAQRAQRDKRNFAVMMIDIDNFKAVNDAHGHGAGDAVLVAIASILQDNLRAVDLVARYGGEEFVVALPDATLPDAQHAAERLRQRVAAAQVPLARGGTLSVTISIGLAIGGPESGPIETVLAQADHALYQAKTMGRDRVRVAPVPDHPPRAHCQSRAKAEAPPQDESQGRGMLRGPLRSDLSSRLA